MPERRRPEKAQAKKGAGLRRRKPKITLLYRQSIRQSYNHQLTILQDWDQHVAPDI